MEPGGKRPRSILVKRRLEYGRAGVTIGKEA
jgi:hypothetical protein